MRRFFTVLVLLCLLAASSNPQVRAEITVDDYNARVGTFDDQTKIVNGSQDDAVRRRAIQVIVAVVVPIDLAIVPGTRHLTDEALIALKGWTSDDRIGADAIVALGATMESALTRPSANGFNAALTTLKGSATDTTYGSLRQRLAIDVLSSVLASTSNSAMDDEFVVLTSALGKISADRSVDVAVRLGATDALIQKGNAVLAIEEAKKVVFAEATKRAAETLLAAKNGIGTTNAVALKNVADAAEQDRKDAEAALVNAETNAAPVLLVIRNELRTIAANFISPTMVEELSSRALITFSLNQRFIANSMLAATNAQGAPNAGGAPSNAGTPAAVDFSKHPLAASSLPSASNMTTAANVLGVSITRPFDPAKDIYNPKRVHKEPLPSTSDEARRARSQGATPATGAFGPPPPPRP